MLRHHLSAVPRCQTFVVLIALLMPGVVTAQSAERVSGRPTCPACRITIQPVIELASSDPGGLPLIPSRVTRDGSGRLLVAPTVTPGTVGVYSSSGEFVQSFGRYGEGPGEMREVQGIAAGVGDSILVVHDRNSVSVFTEDLVFARRFRLESASFIARTVRPLGERGLLAVRIGTGGGDDHPLRIFSAAGAPGRGLGESTGFGDGRIYNGLAAAGDTVWAVDMQSYEIDVFSLSTGALRRTVRRTPRWFTGSSAPRTGFVRPAVVDIARAPDGLFWVLLRRPRETWVPPAQRSGGGPVEAAPRRMTSADLREMFEYILEVVDLGAQPRLVAAASLGDRVADRFVDGEHLYGYTEDETTGVPGLVIWKLGLRRSDQ